ncbi:MAG: sulfate reduction electron transfer complex DsrMKJOP subunit DsrM [Smithella sp.]
MNLLISIVAVLILMLLAMGMTMNHVTIYFLTAIAPYAAIAVFLAGFIRRILLWAKSPVPFRIPTTCGQEKSLPWIKSSPLENPSGLPGVIGRMALEVLLFRSLFRNTDVEMIDGRPVYGSASWLWFFGLVFHGSLLVIILRHLRFFTEPILPGIAGLTAVDGFLELAIPTLYLSDVMLLAAVIFLFVRRIINAPLRYISLAADYFALLLIAAIAVTGLWMRHIQPTDLEQVKALVMGWVTLSPHSPQGVGVVFFIHLFLICVLLAWFPFSKLMHAGGVFLSPTRNLANNSRSQRHMNPWNGPVLVHTYEEYEDEFRDKMKAAGLPVEKE